VPAAGSRQRLTVVSFGTAVDGPLPRAPFAECLTLGKLVFAECRPVPSVQHSVKSLVAESLALPSASLLCRVPDKRHSTKIATLDKALDSGSEWVYTCRTVCTFVKKPCTSIKKRVRDVTLREEDQKNMRIRGIEPRSVPWEGTMIPLHQMRLIEYFVRIIFLFKIV
jgi:hypothetical protein